MTARVSLAAYWAVSVVHLVACLLLDLGRTEAWPLFAATKCALVPLLLAWLAAAAAGPAADLPLGRVRAGLVACFAGDVALLFPGTAAFMAGMGAFGVAHVLFMSAWLRPFRLGAQLKRDTLVYALPLLVFVYIVAAKIQPAVPQGLRLAVIAYLLLVVGDCLCAFLRRNAIDAPSSGSILNGAFIFVQSDSLIALQEFRRDLPGGGGDPPLPLAELMIMGTYVVGLFLIVRGCVARTREAPAPALR
jgi:uncharacterized membrane protein YhhN